MDAREATPLGDTGFGQIDHPNLDGVAVEVQHSLGQGVATKELGLVGWGCVVLPTGQPRVVMQVKHPDGTSLGVLFKKAALITMLECAADADRLADAMAAAAEQAPRQ